MWLHHVMPSKYEPLHQFLIDSRETELTLTFHRIEEILNASLPASARKHSAWWSNERNGRHVQAHSWMRAGWRCDTVSSDEERVTFRRILP